MMPGRPAARFHVELSATAAFGIRDSATGRLHLAVSLGDAVVDAGYLNGQHTARREDEIQTHLHEIASLARDTRRRRPAPPPPISSHAVLEAAAEWNAATTTASEAEAARAALTQLGELRKQLIATEAAVSVAGSRVTAAVQSLYDDAATAHRILTETSRNVPPRELAELVEINPALFGEVKRSESPFPPTTSKSRAAVLAAAIRIYDESSTALGVLRTIAAATLSVDDDDSDSVARALDERITTCASVHQLHPHHSSARTTDRLRALLAVADEKTRSMIVQRFPGIAPIAREARTLTASPFHGVDL